MAAQAIIGTKYLIDLEYIVILLESKALALGFFVARFRPKRRVGRASEPHRFWIMKDSLTRPIRRLRLLNYWH